MRNKWPATLSIQYSLSLYSSLPPPTLSHTLSVPIPFNCQLFSLYSSQPPATLYLFLLTSIYSLSPYSSQPLFLPLNLPSNLSPYSSQLLSLPLNLPLLSFSLFFPTPLSSPQPPTILFLPIPPNPSLFLSTPLSSPQPHSTLPPYISQPLSTLSFPPPTPFNQSLITFRTDHFRELSTSKETLKRVRAKER